MKRTHILRASLFMLSTVLSLVLLVFAIYRADQPALVSTAEAQGNNSGTNADRPLAKGTFNEAGVGCDVINNTTRKGEELPNRKANPYLELAMPNGGTRVDHNAVITEFLKNQDAIFQARSDQLSGSGIKCDLSKSDVPSALKDHGIKPIDLFVAERLFELRQADCALFAILHSPYLLCPLEEGDVITRAESAACDKQMRQLVAKARQDLRYTMKVALIEADEMTTVWPLHKRMECLNESLTEFSKILRKITELYSKYPNTFINQGQST